MSAGPAIATSRATPIVPTSPRTPPSGVSANPLSVKSLVSSSVATPTHSGSEILPKSDLNPIVTEASELSRLNCEVEDSAAVDCTPSIEKLSKLLAGENEVELAESEEEEYDDVIKDHDVISDPELESPNAVDDKFQNAFSLLQKTLEFLVSQYGVHYALFSCYRTKNKQTVVASSSGGLASAFFSNPPSPTLMTSLDSSDLETMPPGTQSLEAWTQFCKATPYEDDTIDCLEPFSSTTYHDVIPTVTDSSDPTPIEDPKNATNHRMSSTLSSPVSVDDHRGLSPALTKDRCQSTEEPSFRPPSAGVKRQLTNNTNNSDDKNEEASDLKKIRADFEPRTKEVLEKEKSDNILSPTVLNLTGNVKDEPKLSSLDDKFPVKDHSLGKNPFFPATDLLNNGVLDFSNVRNLAAAVTNPNNLLSANSLLQAASLAGNPLGTGLPGNLSVNNLLGFGDPVKTSEALSRFGGSNLNNLVSGTKPRDQLSNMTSFEKKNIGGLGMNKLQHDDVRGEKTVIDSNASKYNLGSHHHHHHHQVSSPHLGAGVNGRHHGKGSPNSMSGGGVGAKSATGSNSQQSMPTQEQILAKGSWMCPQCMKIIKYKRNARAHLMSHAAVRPCFSCSYCDQSFTTKWNLKKHLKLNHGIDMEINDPLMNTGGGAPPTQAPTLPHSMGGASNHPDHRTHPQHPGVITSKSALNSGVVSPVAAGPGLQSPVASQPPLSFDKPSGNPLLGNPAANMNKFFSPLHTNWGSLAAASGFYNQTSGISDVDSKESLDLKAARQFYHNLTSKDLLNGQSEAAKALQALTSVNMLMQSSLFAEQMMQLGAQFKQEPLNPTGILDPSQQLNMATSLNLQNLAAQLANQSSTAGLDLTNGMRAPQTSTASSVVSQNDWERGSSEGSSSDNVQIDDDDQKQQPLNFADWQKKISQTH